MNDRQARFFYRVSRGFMIVALATTSMLHTVQASVNAFDSGWAAYEKGDYSSAKDIWTQLALQGHENAQINLGFMYDYGKGVPQNFQDAARWYRAAALQNNAIGQYNLALLISEGKTVPEAGRSAQYWLRQAAAHGYEQAQEQLDNGYVSDASVVKESVTAQDSKKTYRETKAYADESPVSVGTAWPIAAGYAVTNHHVVNGKLAVTLVSRDGTEITANVIASDQIHDIAFLKVNQPGDLPPALPISRGGASLGASVFTIGFPRIDIMGKSPKLSHGIISGVNGLRDDPTSYQISVPIQPGNSGGPLLNMRGEVVGMITAMLGSVVDNDGAATPIPNINYALRKSILSSSF